MTCLAKKKEKKKWGSGHTRPSVEKLLSFEKNSLLAVHSGHLQLVLSALQGCCPATPGLPSSGLLHPMLLSLLEEEGRWATDWRAPPNLQRRQMTATAA